MSDIGSISSIRVLGGTFHPYYTSRQEYFVVGIVSSKEILTTLSTYMIM